MNRAHGRTDLIVGVGRQVFLDEVDEPAFLLQKFKYAVVLAFIIAAVVTPSADMVNQTVLAVPMILLYLLGIAIAYVFGKKVA